MALVIGLHGAKRSGKDDFFKTIKEAYPKLDIRKVAYADPIKREVCRIFELQSEEQYDLFKQTLVEFQLPGYLNHTVQGRRVVREIGMMMRGYDERQFVRYVEEEITKAPNAIWCITDLRFKNELKSIKKLVDGFVIKINRLGVTFDGHISETEFPDKVCSVIIHNNGTLEEYHNQIIIEFENLLNMGPYAQTK